jgi:hypothetical protein
VKYGDRFEKGMGEGLQYHRVPQTSKQSKKEKSTDTRKKAVIKDRRRQKGTKIKKAEK